ncbi:PadR family transcriptional regulator [Staphylococcus aureus]|nr:transcriptional regulator, PadR family [Staphylococcus aureus subsp. aureus 21318]CUF58847.1 PadR family transcriptional regulator [Staphylococcus aureus]
MSVSDQIMKGLLDGAILGLIAQGETYGYEIMTKLKNQEFPEISEGSIYPVLMRLNKKGYVDTTIKNLVMAARGGNTIRLPIQV